MSKASAAVARSESLDAGSPAVRPRTEPPAFTALNDFEDFRIRVTELASALRLNVAAPRRRWGSFDDLVERGVMTGEQLDAALADARRRQSDPATVLIDDCRVPVAEVGKALAVFHRCPFLMLSEGCSIDRDLLGAVKPAYLKQHGWVPIRDREGRSCVVIDDPADLDKLDSVDRVLGSRRPPLAVGLRRDIIRFIDQGEARSDAPRLVDILSDIKAEASEPDVDDGDLGAVDENDSNIIRLVNQMISDAHNARASDIHIEPSAVRDDTVIRFRVDGSCLEYERLPRSVRRSLVARLKILAQLDIAERRLPQDGKIRIRRPEGELELRVATIPTIGGNEDVVLRLLSSAKPRAIDDIELNERNLKCLKAAAEKPYGLILCVGPTGSGKTTTLHSVLSHISSAERKIWTVEDPVEIVQPALRQVQVRPQIGLTFASAMRAFLRADPDVIMLGEMRDVETARTALEASLTGHLVLSTLHTNSALETVTRMLDLGLDSFNFADALLAVLAQRLVKRICDACKESYKASPDEMREIVRVSSREQGAEPMAVTDTLPATLWRGRGCQLCNGTGYRGRVAIHELAVTSEELTHLIQSRARLADMLDCARRDGMTTLLEDGIRKAMAGLTTVRQVLSVALR